ncbi:hypothetical protein HMPREF1544_12094 [Mucor circinelloides 1006PhL]|uniref:Uncharacterized protein n=1 Tax=Mucor circinelloides f. circinelloides (strain 1006PhL) TaxID=1220926 RepID=S2IV69_MUCC1|nr:hypothetical protein HMPREF1544_12094 [Mucor circinelloides 1006PhL]
MRSIIPVPCYELIYILNTRPHYEWTPSEAQVNIMHMDVPIHTSKPMSNVDRKDIIEASSPPVAQLEYRSTANEPNTPNLERFCAVLADMRSLVVDHLCFTITQARMNIAYRTVDPSFSVKTAESDDVGYIVPLLDEFQQSISQQAPAKKALREASTFGRPRRRYPNGNFGSGTFSNGPRQQFFRSGSPSQQGGLNNNNTNSSNNFRQQYKEVQQQSFPSTVDSANPIISTTLVSTKSATTDLAVGGRLSISSKMDNNHCKHIRQQYHYLFNMVTTYTSTHHHQPHHPRLLSFLTQQTGYRESVPTTGTDYSRFLQRNVRHSQKEWRCLTGLQSKTLGPILGCFSFQNGDNQGSSSSDDQTKRLPSF